MIKTVLIIDDDDMLRRTLARGLQNSNFNTITANSAESAHEILSRISVDAIILDRMMTGQDGLSFLRQIRESGNNTPTIMLTAMTGPDNTIDGLSGGADDYLAKPFQIQELILRLNNIIKKNMRPASKMPSGLLFVENEFFVQSDSGPQALSLSGEEKKLLAKLIDPIGITVSATPMVAKRLRLKLNIVLSNLDIITIRGHGYKLIDTTTT
ncbi:MAG: response regulator transcription factor [Alphaproteobacteria bacterium]|nr:response regulator transcription factor [Alphaproteobacteria bacterium]